MALAVPAATGGQPGKVEVRKTEHDADGFFPKHRRETEHVGGKPHGKCRAFGPEDRLLFEQEYVNGLVHGKQVCYYPRATQRLILGKAA